MAYAAVDYIDALASIAFGHYMSNAVDLEMDTHSQMIAIAYELKYHHTDVSKGQVLSSLERVLDDRFRTLLPSVYMEHADILQIVGEFSTYWEGV